MMDNFISVIIPNRNGEATIGRCLQAVFLSQYANFEVIAVDDASTDNSIEAIKQFPCRLIRLNNHSGASKARNAGAFNSRGDVLFFIDADCVIKEDTLSIVNRIVAEKGSDVIIGGTYTKMPYDKRFFSVFQSVFVNYSETKNANSPDYIATHAMVIAAEIFGKTGGFSEDFLPILEDVEFSHRLRRAGYKLVIAPEIQVRHIFNYSLFKSIRNAVRKSMYWTMYSIKNRDLFTDSGTASAELKVNGISWFLIAGFLISHAVLRNTLIFYYAVPAVFAVNIFISRKLLKTFYETKGVVFALLASVYYTALYPPAVGAGALAGLLKHVLNLTKK